MKPAVSPLAVALLLGFSTVLLSGQTARQLTRKVVPNPPQQAARPTINGPTKEPSTGATTAVPAPPIDPVKAAAEKAEQGKRLLAFQKKRAADGSATAQYDLGLRYLKGDGVEPDEAAARKYFEESSKNGNSQAAKKLKELDAAKQPAR